MAVATAVYPKFLHHMHMADVTNNRTRHLDVLLGKGGVVTMLKRKRKRTKPTTTREQQAAIDGWVYVSGSKTIRGWNSIWVEEAREGVQGADEEITRRPYIPFPTGSDLQG